MYTLVICHSNGRCQEWVEFAEQLLTFCQGIVDIVSFEDSDANEVKLQWKKLVQQAEGKEDKDGDSADESISQIKTRNKLVIVTPAQA